MYPIKCIMPVLEGLIPDPYGNYVLDLLFDLALYHGYCKLRMHTDSTLASMEHTLTSLGQQLRKFAFKTSSNFATKELPAELNHRY
jgi:hypothetical protein